MAIFIYKWTKITSVLVPMGCQHVENGIIKKEDLMQTIWTPLNFECPPVNWVLRRNHEHELHYRETFFNHVKKDWLKRLGKTDHVWNEFNFDDATKTQSARLFMTNEDLNTSSHYTFSSDAQDKKGVFKL